MRAPALVLSLAIACAAAPAHHPDRWTRARDLAWWQCLEATGPPPTLSVLPSHPGCPSGGRPITGGCLRGLYSRRAHQVLVWTPPDGRPSSSALAHEIVHAAQPELPHGPALEAASARCSAALRAAGL